jgi:hypothetical protein
MARSFAATGHFLISGVSSNYGFVYPLLLSIPYKLFGPMHDVYRWARVVNALSMCSVVFPTYLLARRVVRPGYALVAAALAVAAPSTIYIGTLMTENAFYPIFMWAAWALVRALEQPTARRQIVLLAFCALAFLTRAQAVALVAAGVTAPLLLAWIERGRPRRLGAWKPLYGIVAVAAVATIVVEVVRGRSPSSILGGYSVTTSNGTYHLWPAIRWVSLFVLPFAAMIVLAASARHLDRALRVFSAASVALAVWLTLEVGVFASSWSFRIEERNLFYLAPLLLVALMAWIERGQPRPPRAAIAAAGVAAVLPGTIPFLQLMNINAESDTPFIQPWWYLGDRVVGDGNVALIVLAVATALAALFLWLPRRFAAVLPVLVALGFLITWLPLQLWTQSFTRLSVAAYTNGISAPHSDWIDRAVGRNADVAAIWTGVGNDPFVVWENEFWNRSLRRVFGLGAHLPGAMPEAQLTIDRSTGNLVDASGRPVYARYVLVDRRTPIVGTQIASDPGHNLVLYRITGPVRIESKVTGWYHDTWTAPDVTWTRTQCRAGVLTLPLSSDPTLFPGVVQRIVFYGSTPTRTVLLPSTAMRTVRLPVTPTSGTCRVSFVVTPSRKPAADPRTLGVRVAEFAYAPSR